MPQKKLFYSLIAACCLVALNGCNSMQAIHTSALEGDTTKVRELVTKGTNVEQKCSKAGGFEGFTPLMMAINNGHEETARYLLDNNANVNASGKLGRTPLHLAAYNGMTDLIKALLSQGANVNAVNIEGATPVHSASIAIKNNKQVVLLLLANGADVNRGHNSKVGPPLAFSARYGDIEVARTLINHGADISAIDINGNNALHVASLYGRLDLANLLMKAQCDVNTLNKVKNSPLHIAAMNGRRMIAEQLVSHGANLVVENKVGDTPLDCAKNYKKETIVGLLEPLVEPAEEVKEKEESADEPSILAD